MPSTHRYRYQITKDIHYAMLEEYATVESCSERDTRHNHIWFNQRYSEILRSPNTNTLNIVNKDVKVTALVTPIICPLLSSTQHTDIPVEYKALAFTD